MAWIIDTSRIARTTVIHLRNEKSIRVLERLGMRREGHLLQNYMSKGNWVDEYQYAVLQSEWLTRHR